MTLLPYLALILGTWVIAALIARPLWARTDYALWSLFVVLMIGNSGSVAAVLIS